MEYLSREFVEDHVLAVLRVPEEWQVTEEGYFYQLNLKMCNIKKLVFSFSWGERVRFVTVSGLTQTEILAYVSLPLALNGTVFYSSSILLQLYLAQQV